jgi:DNA polymerase-2
VLPTEFDAFVLTRQWRDTRNGLELDYWLSTPYGPVRLLFEAQEAVSFIRIVDLPEVSLTLSALAVRRRELTLCNLRAEPVAALYFRSARELRQFRESCVQRNIELYEADVKPCDRFLMERFITGSLRVKGHCHSDARFPYLNDALIATGDYQPALRLVSLDIETAMHDLELFSIGLYAQDGDQVFRKVMMVAGSNVVTNNVVMNNAVTNNVVASNVTTEQCDWLEYYPDQRSLLEAFLVWLDDYDPDGFMGWNVINFDFWYLQKLADHLNMPLRLGRAGLLPHWFVLDEYSQRRTLDIPGRVVLDGIDVLKTAGYRFESFSLQYVSEHLINDGKLLSGGDRGSKISDLFHQDKLALAHYNLQDCELVWRIFAQEKLLAFSLARSQLTGLALDRQGGSVAAFDFQYLPRLHRQGFVASRQLGFEDGVLSPGGYVLDSTPGLYRHVLVFDFKSLYPSIIRSFHIDPLGLAYALNFETDEQGIAGFRGGRFSRQHHILPAIIADLWAERDKAKRDQDSALSQAIKIIMNSFYGVLGSQGCRFFDTRLASSITLRGHEIIQKTRSWIEEHGYPVIYGDTDSVFLWLKGCESDEQALSEGRRLSSGLNRWWRQYLREQFGVESVLEVEFETHYRQFLMPTMRGSERGSKKRYAGLIAAKDGGSELVFKGMENVRTDWTVLAKETQYELYRRVFAGDEYAGFVLNTVRALFAGECDHQLQYRKRLRQKVEDYQRQIPPHVQAVVKAIEQGDIQAGDMRPGDWVEYGVTQAGPELSAYRRNDFDYEHYRDKQLAPVVDALLHFLDSSFDELVAGQLSMF